jgi:hypothetical protein
MEAVFSVVSYMMYGLTRMKPTPADPMIPVARTQDSNFSDGSGGKSGTQGRDVTANVSVRARK